MIGGDVNGYIGSGRRRYEGIHGGILPVIRDA